MELYLQNHKDEAPPNKFLIKIKNHLSLLSSLKILKNHNFCLGECPPPNEFAFQPYIYQDLRFLQVICHKIFHLRCIVVLLILSYRWTIIVVRPVSANDVNIFNFRNQSINNTFNDGNFNKAQELFMDRYFILVQHIYTNIYSNTVKDNIIFVTTDAVDIYTMYKVSGKENIPWGIDWL